MYEYMLRGGAWFSGSDGIRTVYRTTYLDWYGTIGFRIMQDPEYRVLRGSSWSHGTYLLHVTDCYGDDPNYRYHSIGFRVIFDE